MIHYLVDCCYNNNSNNNNKPSKSYNKDNKNNKSVNNDNKDNKDNKSVNNEKSHQILPSGLFSNNITKIIKLVEELKNDEIYDDDEWLVFIAIK